ncbi:uncharacterized protein [Littorina saxatilis]|uniref:uncharacterized protein n=1 Tax=Littorina saxatilis TaxID=31220 RepID=UPI0038B4D200
MDENASSLQPDSDEEWCPQRSSTFRQKDAALARQLRGQRAEQHSDAEMCGAATLLSGGGFIKEALNDLTANLLDTYTTSTSTQTSPKDKENPPLPCFGADWQFSKEMSSLGGSLQKEASDVRLEVPAEAVPALTFVTIKCAISVDIAQVYRKLELCEGEYVVSPIAEYYVRRGFVFQSPVQIVLPHFLPHGFRTESVNVYRFNCDHFGNFSYKKVPLRGKDNVDGSHDDQNVPSSDCFYFGNDGHICIVTSHFSGYVCTYCGKNFPACELHVEVYAKHEEKDMGGRQAKVRLEIWDSRLFIKDFRESQNAIRNQRGPGLNHNMVLMDRKTLAALAPSVEVKDVYVGARLDVFSEGGTCGWQHKHRPETPELCFPVQSTMELKRFVPCPCQSHIPEVVDWLLTNQSNACGIISDVFEFLVDVGYVTSADRNAEGRMKCLPDPSKVTIHVSVSKTMTTLNHTSDVACLGQQLGFPETIKNDLSKANNNHNLQSPPTPRPPFGKPLPSGPCGIGELQSKACTDREHFNTMELTPERPLQVCSCQSHAGCAPEDPLVQPTPDGSLPPVMNIMCHRMDNVVLNLVSPQQGELQPRTDPDPDSTTVKSPASAKNNWCGRESSASCSSPVQCQDDPYPRTTSVLDALDSHISDSTC